MKIAICFSGQIRTGVECAPNILRYIGDLLPQCDFFVHTWDTESIGTGHAGRIGLDTLSAETHEAKVISERAKFADFYRAYLPRTMMVEEYNLQETKNIWGGRRKNPVTGKFYVSMWQSVYEANKLKMDYAQKNQIHYDYTVRIRPDIVFGEHKSLKDDIAQITNSNMFVFGDHYRIWPGHHMNRIEDIYWIGPTILMDQISSYHECHVNTVANTDFPNQPGYQDWQWHCAAWITNQLGYRFQALKDNTMRIFYQVDVDNNTDPLNPGFGNPPGRIE